MPSFTVLHHHGAARTGSLLTDHGILYTPAFLFCATRGTLKGLHIPQIKALHTPILLANTYHLMVQPGSELIEKLGGLHTFMGWDKPLFTDSGGYQIFSLHYGSVSQEIKGKRIRKENHLPLKITEEGALFSSYRDGQRHLLTPEKSILVQSQLGADLICVLDECTPLHMTKQQTYDSLCLSHRWAARSLKAFEHYGKPHQGLYGIIQGGIYPLFRKESVSFVSSLPFFGHAIGGSLGADTQQMKEVIAMALEGLPRDRPIHLLGIGGIDDIFYGVERGIDTFDCVAPTRLGRHGGALIQPHYWDDSWESWHDRQWIRLWKACFRDDPRPLDKHCPCDTCRFYSRAYLHHLLKSHEMLALSALTLHNVSFMNRCMEAIRKGIYDGNLSEIKNQWVCGEYKKK